MNETHAPRAADTASQTGVWSDFAVALVGPLPPPAGGMANQTRQLAELLQGEGASVEVVQVNAPFRPVWVAKLPLVRAIFRLLPYLFALWTAFGRSNIVHVMANSGWSWHLYAAPAVWLACLRGVPVVVNYRGGGAGPFLAQSAPVVARTLRRAAALVVPSPYLQEIFAAHGIAAQVVPNIVNLDRFSPAEAGAGDASRPRVVVPRNLEHIYGNDIALRALPDVIARFPGATLAIAGSGPSLDDLRDLARGLGVEASVEFTGRLDHDAMAALYRSAQIMVNPTRVDNMPNSVLESMASGVPVVATRVGGVPYIVEDGTTALLVEPDQPVALAEAIIRLLEDPELARRLATNGRTEAARYRWDAVRRLLERVYRDAMASSRHVAGSQRC